jgi:cyclopropane fatty-acyl-phospholipid synthase-like methyltransferase
VLTNGREPAMAFANIEQAEFWSQLAPTWLELEDQLEEVSQLPGQLAMDRLQVRPGQRVLELGCGVRASRGVLLVTGSA